MVDVVFEGAKRAAAESAPSRGVPALAWALGGAAVAALGGSAYLGVTGLDDYHALQRGCGKTGSCASGDVDPVRTRLWIADGLLVVGAAALGLGAWIALSSGKTSASTARAGVIPGATGARAEFAVSF